MRSFEGWFTLLDPVRGRFDRWPRKRSAVASTVLALGLTIAADRAASAAFQK
jgi:hypothetical protein